MAARRPRRRVVQARARPRKAGCFR
jgi:hypothetical protein